MGEPSMSDLLKAIQAQTQQAEETKQRQELLEQQLTTVTDVLSTLVHDKGSGGDHALSKASRGGDEFKLNELPEFEGKKDPESYIDWEKRMDRLFEHKGISDSKCFSYAILKLTKNASQWYENMKAKRAREGKQKIKSWSALKAKMKKKFVPPSYKQELYLRYNTLTQSYLSVEDYAAEFERLYGACGMQDNEEQKVAKFVVGLNRDIRHKVEVHTLNEFNDACQLALKYERQLIELKAEPKPLRSYKPAAQFSIEAATTTQPAAGHQEKGDEGTTSGKTQSNDKAKPGQQHMKQVICYKCRGFGHLAKDCKTTMLLSLEEHLALLQEKQQAELHSSTSKHSDSDDMEILDDLRAWKNMPIYGPEGDEHDCLIVRRALTVTQEEQPTNQREKLFKTTCLVNGKHYSLIIDSGSCTNVVSNAMVKEANLPTRAHPKPYKLNWLNEDGSMWVKKQALLSFRVGGYQDKMWCDVLPMTACSILLGRPWQYDRKVLHNGVDNVYSIHVGNGRVGLRPLQPRPPLRDTPTVENFSNKNDGALANSGCCEDKAELETSTKRERREQVLAMRRGSNIQVGDRVWLTLHAQLKQFVGKNNDPIEEGPFKVVEKVGYETFKIDLGDGICATLTTDDLVPCFED